MMMVRGCICERIGAHCLAPNRLTGLDWWTELVDWLLLGGFSVRVFFIIALAII